MGKVLAQKGIFISLFTATGYIFDRSVERGPTSRKESAERRARAARSRATTRPSLAVLNVCVGAIAARAHRTALAHGIHRVRSGAFLHGALLAIREHTCVSLCLS